MSTSIKIATQAKDGQAIIDLVAQATRAITQLVSVKANLLAVRDKIQASLTAGDGIYHADDIADINAQLAALGQRIQSELLG